MTSHKVRNVRRMHENIKILITTDTKLYVFMDCVTWFVLYKSSDFRIPVTYNEEAT